MNQEHERGSAKARLLYEFGYTLQDWVQLENDIREYHLSAEVQIARESSYGRRYEISAVLETPSGRLLKVRTIWQIDRGTDFPRLITLIPD